MVELPEKKVNEENTEKQLNEKELRAKNLRQKNLMLLIVIVGFCAILFVSIILSQQGF